MVDSNDLANELPVTVKRAKVFLVALRSKVAPPTQDSEIIGKRFSGIYTIGKKVLLYVRRATKKFLLDSNIKPTHTELNFLQLHQCGCSGYIENTPDPDTTYFSIHDIIAMISNVSYANSSG